MPAPNHNFLITITMARSKSFFGLRRGSTKSHTYSILNGQQITKDRVQTVANPKTQKQQFQRAIMATVMAAYSEMKAIEDHAFQGKKKGSENQREFMSRNLVAMRNAFLQYQSKGTAADAQKFWAVGPKTPTVLPCEWVISHGTMDEQTFLTFEDGDFSFKTPNFNGYTEVSGGFSGALGDLADSLGILPGMQITFICINATNGPRIYQIDPANFGGYHDFKFRYCRIAFKYFDRDQIVSTPAGSVDQFYEAFLSAVIDTTRSTPSVVNALKEDYSRDDKYSFYTYDANLLLAGAAFDETLTAGLGIITSMVDQDLRSTSKMLVRAVNYTGPGTGLGWTYVPLAWQLNADGLGESELYLEGGSV